MLAVSPMFKVYTSFCGDSNDVLQSVTKSASVQTSLWICLRAAY